METNPATLSVPTPATVATFESGYLVATLRVRSDMGVVDVSIDASEISAELDHDAHGYIFDNVDLNLGWRQFRDLTEAIEWAQTEVVNLRWSVDLHELANEQLAEDLAND